MFAIFLTAIVFVVLCYLFFPEDFQQQPTINCTTSAADVDSLSDNPLYSLSSIDGFFNENEATLETAAETKYPTPKHSEANPEPAELLSTLSIRKLKKLASTAKIPYYSTMTKGELLAWLNTIPNVLELV